MRSYSKPFQYMTHRRVRVIAVGIASLLAAIGYTAVAFLSANNNDNTTKNVNEVVQPVSEAVEESPSSNVKKNDTTLEAIIETDNSTPPKADIKVNGQPIPLPASGSLHEIFQDSNGTTKLDVSIDSQSSGSTSIDSSTSINLNTHTETEVEGDNTE